MNFIDNMTNEKLFEFVEKYIVDKITQNSKIVRYSYYELKVKLALNERVLDKFLKYSKIILDGLGYQVFFTGARFKFENADRVVESNEFMIAIKQENEDC